MPFRRLSMPVMNGAFVNLMDLRPGQAAIVGPESQLKDCHVRFMEMGLTPGARLRFLRAAPLGGPIQIELRGYLLSIRRDDAACIQVIPEPESSVAGLSERAAEG